MKSFFKFMFAGMFGSILALIIVALIGVLVIVGIAKFSDEDIVVKEKSVLKLSFENQIADRSSTQPNISKFSIDTKLGLSDITDAIKTAEKDDNIKGIWLNLSSIPAGVATVEEIRNSLLDFKKSGKFIIANADFYTHKSYYLASTADKIYLTPEGDMQFMGLSAQIMFFKSMLEKIGVEPEIIRHGKFKSAVEPFMLDQMSDANREQTLKYVGSIWNNFLKGISKERKISIENLNLYADSLYIKSAKAALEYKMIDELKYYDMVVDELKTLTEIEKKDDLNTVSLSDYLKTPANYDIENIKKYTNKKIAVIYASGQINMGKGDDETIGSASLSKSIREARMDTSVKAIVLRVNSPGGSALASEIIWRETILAKKEKPFIVSMGDVAASGGYYIACFADTIVAEPNTITGSIGVFGLLFNTVELMNKIGVNTSTVNTNKHADIGSPTKKMTPFERAIIQEKIEDIYDTFITHVAEGRGMTKEDIDSIGQGRVWSGKDALDNGLVDVMGGLQIAIDIASQKSGLEDYKIKVYPEKEMFEKIIGDLFKNSKNSIIEEELGETYILYRKFKKVKEIKGIQARLPYFVEIN